MKIDIPIPAQSLNALAAIFPELTSAVQGVYDQWEQIDGFDVELGTGGICQDIASAMAGRMGDAGFEDVLVVSATVGENHVFVIALLDDGVYQIDIAPYHYETGAGYRWKKKPSVKFVPEMISFFKVDERMPSDEFFERFAEG